MSDKFKITFECNGDDLGAIIIAAIRENGNLIDVASIGNPHRQMASEDLPNLELPLALKDIKQPKLRKTIRKKKGWTKNATAFEIYQAIVDAFPYSKEFTSKCVGHELEKRGIEVSTPSGHMTHMTNMGVLRRVGGDGNVGWIYQIAKNVTENQFKNIRKESRNGR